MEMKKKAMGKQKTFQEEGHNQGARKVPIPQVKEYGTGLPFKKPASPLAKKKAVGRGR